MHGVIGVFAAAGLIALGAAWPGAQARADVQGMVYEVLNPEAPWGEKLRQPLPGAYVVLTWDVTIPAPAHATSWCLHSEIARTDQKGEYVMERPGWLGKAIADVRILVYAQGRERVNYPYGGSPVTEKDITMAKSTRPPEEHLGGLFGHSILGCGSDHAVHDPKGLLPSYYRALAAEARDLNVTSEVGRRIVQSLQVEAERHDPGYRPPGSSPIRVVPAPAEGALQRANPAPAQ